MSNHSVPQVGNTVSIIGGRATFRVLAVRRDRGFRMVTLANTIAPEVVIEIASQSVEVIR